MNISPTSLSQFPIKTLRETPSYADTPGYQYLIRAGFVRPASAGIFTLLPFGMKVISKIETIVREEIEAIGGVEVLFPALLPKEPFETTGRWEEFGESMFKLQDRKSSDYLLAPTHEEMFTLLGQEMFYSYQDFPAILYQIQTKYRDEVRPRAGLIRGREFIMKDSYSFDLDTNGLEASYQKHRQAYQKIFDRLGFDYVIVSAQSGAMGGSKSEEFFTIAAIGEDTFITTPSGFASNVEAFITHNGGPAVDPETGELLIQDGDLAQNGEPITLHRGIELAHIFQLGQKYAQAYNWTVQNQNSERITPTMGSYGIGISRILATFAELSRDDKGLIWSEALSPYDFQIIQAVSNDKVQQTTSELAKQLTKRGYTLLIDDRPLSAGVKFKDAELIGIPKTIIIGNLIKDHKLELKHRASGSTEVLTLDQLYSKF
jgi:prolyl-tRNA synthetase